MRRAMVVAMVLAMPALAGPGAQRALDDAKAIDRVVEMAPGGMPVEILRRIATEDIDLLRGRHADETYDYAHYDRLEAGRISDSFSIQPAGPDRLAKIETRGEHVYRLVLDVPARRLVVAHNRPLWIDRVEIDYVPQMNAPRRTQVVKVGQALEPGTFKTIDFEAIARQATVTVFARAEEKSGYGDLDTVLIQAKIFDNPDSPYASAVTSAKSLLHALDQKDGASVRVMAQRMIASLQSAAVLPQSAEAKAPSIDVVAPRVAEIQPEVTSELQAIEDLLTGTDAERRQGSDRLHQLLRRLRSH